MATAPGPAGTTPRFAIVLSIIEKSGWRILGGKHSFSFSVFVFPPHTSMAASIARLKRSRPLARST